MAGNNHIQNIRINSLHTQRYRCWPIYRYKFGQCHQGKWSCIFLQLGGVRVAKEWLQKRDICSNQFSFFVYFFRNIYLRPRNRVPRCSITAKNNGCSRNENKPNRKQPMRRPRKWNKNRNDLRLFQLLLVFSQNKKPTKRKKNFSTKPDCFTFSFSLFFLFKVKKSATFSLRLFLVDLYPARPTLCIILGMQIFQLSTKKKEIK